MSSKPDNTDNFTEENYNAAVVNNITPQFDYSELVQHIARLIAKPENTELKKGLIQWLRQLEKFLVKAKDVKKLEVVLAFREDLEFPVQDLKRTLRQYDEYVRSWENAEKKINLVKGKIGGTRRGNRRGGRFTRSRTRKNVRR
jgi:hypothetical protein